MYDGCSESPVTITTAYGSGPYRKWCSCWNEHGSNTGETTRPAFWEPLANPPPTFPPSTPLRKRETGEHTYGGGDSFVQGTPSGFFSILIRRRSSSAKAYRVDCAPTDGPLANGRIASMLCTSRGGVTRAARVAVRLKPRR